jgi:RNA polymerase sigma-70 factor (ECF subfamily)
VAPGLYRLAYSILLDQQDSEDVVQEAMVYVFRNLHHYDPSRGAVRTWLYTITVSRCRNARRRHWLPTTALAHLLNLGLEPAVPEDHTPEAAVARMGVREALEKALTRLSPRLREAIALRYGQGLTYREMADVLDCPQKTAESRVRLAHEALREVMTAADDVALLEELWSF